MVRLCGGALEYKISWEPLPIAIDRLIQVTGGYAVESGQFKIENHSLASKQINGLRNLPAGDDRFAHCRIVRQATAPSLQPWC